MKIGVVGCRHFNDYRFLKAILVKHTKLGEHSIVSGGAKGADSLAKKYAQEFNIPIEEFFPDWNRHGRSAGPRRNKQIVDASDIIIAFWNGRSMGTASTVGLAVKVKKPVYIYWSEAILPDEKNKSV